MAEDTFAVLEEAILQNLSSEIGADMLPSLLDSLLQELAQAQIALQKSYDGQDFEQFEIKAHSIKSAARSFGALELGEAAYILEQQGRKKALTQAAFADYIQKCDRAVTALKAYHASLSE